MKEKMLMLHEYYAQNVNAVYVNNEYYAQNVNAVSIKRYYIASFFFGVRCVS